MPRSTSTLVALLAACSGRSAGPVLTTTTESAEVITVPVIAATRDALAPKVEVADLQPPWSLTASDGSGLQLTRVDARAVFEGPLAFTELHLYFYNHEDRVREGTFQITLPQDAAVSRFAMQNDGQWLEAEVVEKQLARRAYDDFLHMRQDPALLEKAAGNQFTAKVFPIAGRSTKHIVISYSQELPGAQYTLPLRGLPRTERVDVTLAVGGADGQRVEQKLSERNWQPDRDFVSTADGTAQALAANNYVVAQVEVGDTPGVREAPAGVTILVDTSASRALGFTSYVRSIGALVDSLRTTWGPTLPVQLIAFDQDAEEIFRGQAYELGDTQLGRLLERGAAGASDLGQALAWTAQHAPLSRVLVVTDGVITAGSEGTELQKHVSALASVKVERIDFALAGGLRDDKAMAALVRAGLQRAGTVLDLQADPVATAIAETVSLDVKIEIPGADWVYPRHLPAVRAGTRTTVYARIPQPTRALDVLVSGKPQRVHVLGGTPPLVERAVAAAEIAELEANLVRTPAGKEAASLRATIAKKSVAARVLSSQTSLLVLESDDDYARYGIDRRALADVLVVNANGSIERRNRRWTAKAMPVVPGDPQLATPATEIASADAAEGAAGDSFAAEKKMKQESAGLDEVMAKSDDASPGAAGAASSAPVPHAPAPPPAAARPEPVPSRDAAAAQRRVADVREHSERAERRRSVRISADVLDNPLASAAVAHDDAEGASWPPRDAPPALTGELASVIHLVKARRLADAITKARRWHQREPGNVLALIALGEALEATGRTETAARMYGSIIDLFPGRADMRRFAGERLSRLTRHSKDLIVDTYRRAVADRPDHMTGHRLLAYALVRAGKHAEAFAAILAGIDREYRSDSYAGGERVLREDATMIGAAYAAAEPGKREDIQAQLKRRGLAIATRPSTRFILYWETDANDVDFHIQDARGGHAFYSSRELPSGGELYADITTGYGPECFAIPGHPKAGPYRLSIDYYSQGPMGYGMGLLQVQRFDGKGGLSFEDRPYVIMNDHAYVDLGTVR